MSVAKSATSAMLTATAGSSQTVDTSSIITVGASDTFLLFMFECDTTTPGTVTIHWDNGGTNQVMTQIGLTTDSTNGVTTAFYGLVNPTAGAKKFDWTLSSTTNGTNFYRCAISFTGSITTSVAAATYAFNSNTSTSAVANATVSSASAIATGDMAVTAYVNDTTGFSNAFTAGTNPGDGGTAIGQNQTLTNNMSAEYYSGAGAVINSSAACSTTSFFVAIITGIAAPASNTFIPPPPQDDSVVINSSYAETMVGY